MNGEALPQFSLLQIYTPLETVLKPIMSLECLYIFIEE
jgi:hypothetical protein